VDGQGVKWGDVMLKSKMSCQVDDKAAYRQTTAAGSGKRGGDLGSLVSWYPGPPSRLQIAMCAGSHRKLLCVQPPISPLSPFSHRI